MRWLAEHTLASATARNPVIGYDRATEVVHLAEQSGMSLFDAAIELGIDDGVLRDRLDPRRIARGNEVD